MRAHAGHRPRAPRGPVRSTKVAPISAITFALSAVAVVSADPLAETMRAWCSQSGTWAGQIAMTNAQGKTQTVKIVSRHSCTPDARYHVVEEDFIASARRDHTVKVTYVDPASKRFRTEYFAANGQSTYMFEFGSIEWRDPSNWSQTVQSPSGTESFEGRPAILRYTRTRRGDRVISRKEVKFLDSPSEFVTRSLIDQRRR
jgi:hypothetical protein